MSEVDYYDNVQKLVEYIKNDEVPELCEVIDYVYDHKYWRVSRFLEVAAAYQSLHCCKYITGKYKEDLGVESLIVPYHISCYLGEYGNRETDNISDHLLCLLLEQTKRRATFSSWCVSDDEYLSASYYYLGYVQEMFYPEPCPKMSEDKPHLYFKEYKKKLKRAITIQSKGRCLKEKRCQECEH